MAELKIFENMEELTQSKTLADQAFLPEGVMKSYMETGGNQISDMDPNHAVQVFHVMASDGKMVEAELLELIDMDDKTFAIYKAPVVEGGEMHVDACYVMKDENGFDHIAIIDDKMDKMLIREYINSEWKEF